MTRANAKLGLCNNFVWLENWLTPPLSNFVLVSPVSLNNGQSFSHISTDARAGFRWRKSKGNQFAAIGQPLHKNKVEHQTI
jgi:hypothetical protein